MGRIGWGITGAGNFLLESFSVMEEAAENHEIACYLSDAGERTVRIYGLWDNLKEVCPGDYYQEIVLGSDQGGASPISGRFQRGRHQVLIISPASANTVSKIVTGVADTLVTSAFAQAGKGDVPILIVPTDQEGKKTADLPHMVHREVCREELGTSHDECQILEACPYDAIIDVGGLPKIDLAKCEGCGICLENCPYGAVSFGEKTEVNLREIDLKNVERLKEFKDVSVLESPEEIPNAMEEVLDDFQF